MFVTISSFMKREPDASIMMLLNASRVGSRRNDIFEKSAVSGMSNERVALLISFSLSISMLRLLASMLILVFSNISKSVSLPSMNNFNDWKLASALSSPVIARAVSPREMLVFAVVLPPLAVISLSIPPLTIMS